MHIQRRSTSVARTWTTVTGSYLLKAALKNQPVQPLSIVTQCQVGYLQFDLYVCYVDRRGEWLLRDITDTIDTGFCVLERTKGSKRVASQPC